MKLCPSCTGAGNVFILAEHRKIDPNRPNDPPKRFATCPDCFGHGVVGLSPEQLIAFEKEKLKND